MALHRHRPLDDTAVFLGKIMSGWRIEPVPFTDGLSAQDWPQALGRSTAQGPVKIVYLETPTNSMINLTMVPPLTANPRS